VRKTVQHLGAKLLILLERIAAAPFLRAF